MVEAPDLQDEQITEWIHKKDGQIRLYLQGRKIFSNRLPQESIINEFPQKKFKIIILTNLSVIQWNAYGQFSGSLWYI